MNHTPGPWGVQGHGNDADVYVADKEIVAWVGDPFDKKETEANAHLIAAAPDMLAMLEEIRECAYRWSEIRTVEQLDKVIRKARGEE